MINLVEIILGAILVVAGIISTGDPGLSYDAANIVGAILLCFGLLFVMSGVKGLLSR